jgi:hypothetical protein
VYCSTTAQWRTLVDGWRHELGKRNVVDLDVARPSARTTEVTQRFQADATAGRIHHDRNRQLARHIAAARLARTRNLPHLAAPSRSGGSIAAAFAALLAWEAHAILGPNSHSEPGLLLSF